ncbi:WXG100 family type VII secretion target [Saccharopolyspora tripterygii]
MAEAEDVFTKLKSFEQAVARNIDTATDEMFGGWSGEAADAAHSYFSQLSKAMSEHATAINSLAEQYHNTAYGVWAICKSMVSTLEMLADILIGLALELAATALLSETGVGLIAGSAIAAYLVFKANNTWMKVLDLQGKMMIAVTGFSGSAGAAVSTLRGLTEVPLPGEQYDNKSVGP